MNEVNKTLYIPLYGKAQVSRKKIIIRDQKAEEIWEKEKFPLKGKAKSKWLTYYMAMRAKIDDKVVGCLLFSKENNMLCFLAVDRECRRQHIGEKMLSLMLTLIDPKKDIIVTTYREGVPEGIAARAFYKSLGFREGKLTEEFGSPVQEFILKR